GGGPNRHATVIEGGREAKSVWNNTIPGMVPVTLSVNMNNEITKGTFVARENYVDVAGSMNGWGGDWNDELYDLGGDGIYVTIPAAFAPVGGEGDTMQYKFRIDSSWDDDKSEFPGGGPNRKYVVLDTVGGYVNEVPVVWFNDVELGINDKPISFQEISFYPNPVTDIMYIENKVDMQMIMITNILGQEVVRMELENRRTYEYNAQELVRGLYILSVYGEQGYVGAAKFIKK
ncbi:MAG TPA: T9SS type A sorting domain-containing protein, partial [Bacteroides sp.]|nr:T9SS type A sorting domain-containing protein [Bacteroides sp.]